MNYATSTEALHCAMKACLQAPDLNMLEHGEQVHASYCRLMEQLQSGEPTSLPLAQLYAKYAEALPDPASLAPYHLYHDCGKHLCLTTDADGRRQFPGHAAASAAQYALLFPDDKLTAELIAKDMDFHACRGDVLQELCRHPHAAILYFTAWAEVLANAEMFGGRTSDSFKMKAKRLTQAGKKLLNQ